MCGVSLVSSGQSVLSIPISVNMTVLTVTQSNIIVVTPRATIGPHAPRHMASLYLCMSMMPSLGRVMMPFPGWVMMPPQWAAKSSSDQRLSHRQNCFRCTLCVHAGCLHRVG